MLKTTLNKVRSKIKLSYRKQTNEKKWGGRKYNHCKVDINKLPRTCVHESNKHTPKMILLCSSNGNLVSNLPIFL